MTGAGRTALITGVSGQDGVYLSRLLLAKGYRVTGATRDAGRAAAHLGALGLARVELFQTTMEDRNEVRALLQSLQPDEIYHLSGQSSVAQSFVQPAESILEGSRSTIGLLEALRLDMPGTRLFHATSSECFGNTPESGASETTPFAPLSPYGVSKAASHLAVETYRKSYGVHCCSGILFNHESAIRPARFVTRKVVEGARQIAKGEASELRLGRTDVVRDWGLAPEYVEAMWLQLQQDSPEDYVMATGRASSLQDFIEVVFSRFGLRWQDHVVREQALLRPQDIRYSLGDPSKIRRNLGWTATGGIETIADVMIENPPANEQAPA